MHNLSANFLMFLDIAKSIFKSSIYEDDNFKFYPRKPKLSDCQIIVLSLTAESSWIDSENYLFWKLKSDYQSEFPDLLHRSNFNRRKNTLSTFILGINQHL